MIQMLIEGEARRCEVSGRLHGKQIAQIRKELERYIQDNQGKDFVLDLGELKTYNSIVLSLLLCLLRKAHDLDMLLTFENIPDRLYDMARVGGLESILPR